MYHRVPWLLKMDKNKKPRYLWLSCGFFKMILFLIAMFLEFRVYDILVFSFSNCAFGKKGFTQICSRWPKIKNKILKVTCFPLIMWLLRERNIQFSGKIIFKTGRITTLNILILNSSKNSSKWILSQKMSSKPFICSYPL